MNHGKKTVKLSRTQSHRDAMLANMATSLILHEKIKTTTPKAKALRPLVDRLISTAKEGSLHSKRRVARTIRDKAALKKLFNEIVPKLEARNSGYSRLMRAGFRNGDGAALAVLEFSFERVEAEPTEKKKKGRLSRIGGRKKKDAEAKAAPAAKKGKKKAAAAEAAPADAEEPEAAAEAEGEAESEVKKAEAAADGAEASAEDAETSTEEQEGGDEAEEKPKS